MSASTSRILIVLPSLERGGGERVLLQLAASFAEAGRDVHVVALLGGGPLRSTVPEAVTLHEFIDADAAAKGLTLARIALPRLVSLLRALKPHAVLSTITGTNLLTTLACMRAGVRTRLVLREASSLVNARSAFKRQAMRWLYRRADALVAVSAGVAHDLCGLGLAQQRIHVIRNPVDVDRLRQQAAVGLPSSLNDKTPYVVSVGRLTEAKDFPTLLRAYAASELRHSHHLVIVGEGEQRANLESLVRDLDLADRVLLTGAMDNPHGVMAGAAMYILSSRWEGYPNALLEALALGVPVIATDCQHGPREILDTGRHGRLVPVGDVAALANAMDSDVAQASASNEWALADHLPRAIATRYLTLLDGDHSRRMS